MSRRIHCEKCGWKPLYPEDVLQGWHHRIVRLKVKAPANHGYTVTEGETTKTVPLSTIVCDVCGEPIPDGALAYAETRWRDQEIGEWESEFGEIA
jgi:hypothetical protein